MKKIEVEYIIYSIYSEPRKLKIIGPSLAFCSKKMAHIVYENKWDYEEVETVKITEL